LRLPAARLGLGYGFNGLQRFINTIGPSHTKDIFFSARQFGADEAFRMGVVSRVVPDGELDAFVKEYAGTIADNAPLTVGPSSRYQRGAEARERAQSGARAAGLWRAALPARTTSRAAPPSWRSASRSFTGK
jgi:enoyl-CoA hydratase/carnithine racemase